MRRHAKADAAASMDEALRAAGEESQRAIAAAAAAAAATAKDAAEAEAEAAMVGPGSRV